jgi:hypothetical protein
MSSSECFDCFLSTLDAPGMDQSPTSSMERMSRHMAVGDAVPPLAFISAVIPRLDIEAMVTGFAETHNDAVIAAPRPGMTTPTDSGGLVPRSVQMCGGLGVSDDLPVARLAREVRPFRIYDGPSEVHRWAIARRRVAGAVRAAREAVG